MGEGVRPLSLAWGPERELEVVGRPLATAVGLHRRRERMAVGLSEAVEVLSIGPDLEVTAATRQRRAVDRDALAGRSRSSWRSTRTACPSAASAGPWNPTDSFPEGNKKYWCVRT